MRAANVTATVLTLLAATAAVEAQEQRSRTIIQRPGGGIGVYEKRTHVEQRPQRAAPSYVGHHHHDHHHDHHHNRIPYGYGYGYGGFGFGVPGGSFNYYRGPATWGPGINPPVYAFPPYGYGSYGYGSAWYPTGPDPLNNALLQQQYDNDWRRLSANLAELALKNESDPVAGTTAVPVPSTPEAKIKSLRYQAQGNAAFLRQDYRKALENYRAAASTTRDDGAASFRVGYALVASGRHASAIEYFKRGLAIDPALAITGPTPTEMYGDNHLAWTSHLGLVTRWVAEDVRDAQRVFLLGLLLYFDGDTRAREFLEKAWQLSGGTETAVVTLLSPPQVEGVKVIEPADREAGEGAIGGAGEGETAEGPRLDPAAPADAGDDLDLPEIPVPPAATPGRAPWEEPLFPLPSEQGDSQDDPAAPPLPAPAR